MPPILYVGHVTGDSLPAADWNSNWQLVETSSLDLGGFVISGLVPTIGTGLSVAVSAGNALIGADIVSPGFTIAGLTDNSTNHLYLLQSGAGFANTSGTQPAASAKLGTCVTLAGVVSSVGTNRSSGRQLRVRTDNLIPGGPGAGNPPSINLANWAAAAADSVPVFGVLPAGAVPAASPAFTAAITDTVTDAATAVETSLVTLTHKSSGTPAVGFGTAVEFDGDDSANINRKMGKCAANWKVATSGATVSQLELYAAAGASFVPCLIADGTQVVTALGAFVAAGHVLSTGTIPTVAAGAGAGGSPPAPVIVAGSTDVRGTITFGSGTAPGGGPMVRLTFNAAFAATPFVFLQNRDDSITTEGLSVANQTTGHWDIYFHNAPAASQPNTKWVVHYFCLG